MAIWNPYFDSLGGLIFCLDDHQTLYYFYGYFCLKTSYYEISNLRPKSWVNPYEKISIWPLFRINICMVYEGFFSTWMIIKQFQGSFVQNRTEIKIFPIFEQNHGLTPLKQSQYVHCVKSIFFSSRKALFLTGWSANIISRPSLSKNNQRGKFQFLTKIMF